MLMPAIALLFDLENTFFDGTFWHRQLHQMVTRWTGPIGYQEFKSAWQTRWLPRVYSDQLEYWAALKGLLNELKIAGCIQTELLASAQARLRSAQAGLRPFPGVAEALAECQRSGCRLGILSNSIFRPNEVEALLRRIGLLVRWDYCQTSRAAGEPLPTAWAFQAAIRDLGTLAAETLYVSRHPQRLALAHESGLQTCSLGDRNPGMAQATTSCTCLRELAFQIRQRRAA